MRREYGLIGKDISHSFSKGYFTEKFKRENISDAVYHNIDISEIDGFKNIFIEFPNIKGLNVTIPYKEKIITLLEDLDLSAREVRAVNTIKVFDKNRTVGYNTDIIGFEQSLIPLLKKFHNRALILGTGGASKAVVFVLKKIGIDFVMASRNPIDKGQISYSDIDENIMRECKLIVNTTPLGTYPIIDVAPDIPYHYLTKDHFLFDLIYNPDKTLFLQRGMKSQSTCSNGFRMLCLQAEESWKIWNE
ncbi:shikimate dehydrogenase family protein [Ichthyobacterium seriolicida]|uniref:Shikimate 5-dehydrogenase I alpha n=1 Tax=Ichthyobacterium seriolicida TaxID=242600 RepID=A0A169Q436_9FLAO|nr:shikimate dehydrogenase [Ichthyobacterium seriolicida]BAU88534.1 shikimate dehydrogenase [Ichthyobacterium seriolicida]BAV95322.1 shikimate 5-dehydrogenase I alpha [Ichthyobacterium seriolicida]